MAMELKQKKYRDREEAIDLFGKLPIELIHTIYSFLITPKTWASYPSYNTREFEDTKEAVRTIILSKKFLQAWSTYPDLYFSDVTFSKLLNHHNHHPVDANQIHESRERLANYVGRTLTRYQKHNIPIRKLHLTAFFLLPRGLPPHVEDEDRTIVEQSILKACKYDGVKEVYLQLVSNCIHSKFLQTIFAVKQLVSLYLYGGHLGKNGTLEAFDDIFFFINCSSLRILKLEEVGINDVVLQKLIHSFPLIEGVEIKSCRLLETIQIVDLPNLKSLDIDTHGSQIVDVKAPSLELMKYTQSDRPYMLHIRSTQNLKTLILEFADIRDSDFHNLIANCPVLEELTLQSCDEIQKVNISSQSLSFLAIRACMDLMEVKIDAPVLNMFEFLRTIDTDFPSLSFADEEGYVKRKSSVSLFLFNLEEASPFLDLSEFLRAFKRSDTISLTIISMEKISFDINIMDGLRGQNGIPEFDQVHITIDITEEAVCTTSSMYSTLMEGLLWSFSPKIISVQLFPITHEKIIKYLCEELLVQHDDNPDISASDSDHWRKNYFKHAKIEDKDDEWRPLHSWKSLADVLENLGDKFILKLSQD